MASDRTRADTSAGALSDRTTSSSLPRVDVVDEAGDEAQPGQVRRARQQRHVFAERGRVVVDREEAEVRARQRPQRRRR